MKITAAWFVAGVGLATVFVFGIGSNHPLSVAVAFTSIACLWAALVRFLNHF
jgi:hypothetical protein